MLIHSTYTYLFTGSVLEMSDNSDSQNRSEEHVNLSEGTSPSKNSYDEGSRSTPSNFPKATTRQTKKKTSDSEDKDFEVEEVASKKKLLKKEYGTAAATKPGMQKKAPPRRAPMSKPRNIPTKETMQLTIEQSDDDEASGKKKKKKRQEQLLLRCLESLP